MLVGQRKKTYCQNCHYPLQDTYNYCPNCSQENSDKLVSFGTLVYEFFGNMFAYDSRLVRTISPFLLKPGFLTTEFITGRRAHYMHPLRLYFIISVFYFFVVSIVISKEIKKDGDKDMAAIGNREELASTDIKIQEKGQSPNVLSDSLKSIKKKDSSSADVINPPAQIDSIVTAKENKKDSFSSTIGKTLKTEGITPEAVLDSFNLSKKEPNLFLARQSIKLANASISEVINFILSKASLMMFVLLPFFALILKLFYLRTKRYYIEHITFTLHIHAFIFFIFALAVILDDIFEKDWIFTLTIYIVLLYIILAFKRVYQQGWMKTILKVFLLFFNYCFSVAFFILLTVTISFLLF